MIKLAERSKHVITFADVAAPITVTVRIFVSQLLLSKIPLAFHIPWKNLSFAFIHFAPVDTVCFLMSEKAAW